MRSSGFNRRQFIKFATYSAVGMSLSPWQKAEALQMANFLVGLRRFATGVGASVLARQISEYLSSLRNEEYRRKVVKANTMLAIHGFTNMTKSEVWRIRAGLQNQVFYPLVYQQCGPSLHFAAPFFSEDCGCEYITHIEGGHMVGLALGVEALIAESHSSDYARSVLLPKEGLEVAESNKKGGYKNPVRYKSDKATVGIDYEPKDEQSGQIIIEAVSETDGTLLGKKFDVRFA